MGFFKKKVTEPNEIEKILKLQLLLEGALTMRPETLQITKEVTIQSMKKDHGISEATARQYYDKVLNELKQGKI